VVETCADWTHQRTGTTDPDIRRAAEDAWTHLVAAAEALDTARAHMDNASATINSSLPDAPAPPRSPIRLRPADPAMQRAARAPSPAALGLDRRARAAPTQPGRPPVPRTATSHR
jgi:uncharacterized membrane protein YccC